MQMCSALGLGWKKPTRAAYGHVDAQGAPPKPKGKGKKGKKR
jgi:hypothetical protein